MYDGSDTIVLYEELAYQDVLPVAWRPLPDTLDADLSAAFGDANVRVLQACAAIEEHGHIEKQDENAPHAADLLRMDLKLSVLLDLVGRILAGNQPRPPATMIRFNALGATWRSSAALPKPGAQGTLEIYLRECLPDPLRLIGRVTNVTAEGEIKARFLPPGEATADLLEKLSFRRHRRQIAGTRQPRRGQ
jgi:hypothetical protein